MRRGLKNLGIPCIAPWVLAACGRYNCDLPSEAMGVAGADAAACGDIAVTEDTSPLFVCLDAAWQAGERAWGVHRVTGIDSVISTAVVLDGVDVWLLRQDSYGGPSGRVTAVRCVGPVWGSEGLECGATEPEADHFMVCGCEPGDGRPLAFPGREVDVDVSERWPSVATTCAVPTAPP